MLQARAERRAETGRINLPKRFDLMSTLDFRTPFVRLLKDASVRRLAVDLSGVSYIDSMGIGMLLCWHRSCEERDKALVLERCEPKVMRSLRHAGVAGVFSFS